MIRLILSVFRSTTRTMTAKSGLVPVTLVSCVFPQGLVCTVVHSISVVILGSGTQVTEDNTAHSPFRDKYCQLPNLTVSGWQH